LPFLWRCRLRAVLVLVGGSVNGSFPRCA
jgi:hypothetical protein